MNSLKIVAFAFVFLLPGCAASPTPSVASMPARASAGNGIENAHEFSGVVESWGKAPDSSSTLSVWIQEINNTKYILFQIRASLDTYRFALSRDHIVSLIDALYNYEKIVRQTADETKAAVGWLYRADVKMKRMGEDARDDRVLINVERAEKLAPVLSLTFDSWLLSFGGPYSPAERSYRAMALPLESATRLRNVLSEFANQL